MKKLLLIILSFFIMVWTVAAADRVVQVPLIERIMNHPDAVQMGENWYRIVIKENISKTDFDWRFDMRMIDIMAGHLTIGHRLEQNSGNVPDSSWVIEYTFIDKLTDGTLDYFDKDRFISISVGNGAWYRVGPSWPDEFRYPDLLSEEEALILYKKELEWWDNKL